MVISNKLLFITVLVEGFVSIGVEIFAIRQMIPYVGSNILNTSIIIGVFLLFLSLGYYRGGLIKKDFEQYLLNNLINSTLILSFGLSSLFLSWYYDFFEKIGNIYGLIIFTFIIIAPIIYLLGQTIPIVTNFMKNLTSSKINGTLLFLSTIGSFLGSIITSTVLLNFLGVDNTLIVYITILFILIVILSKYIKLNKFYYFIRILSIILITIVFNSKSLYLYSNTYSNVSIKKDNNNTKYLIINDSFSSSYNEKLNNSTFESIKFLQKQIKNIDYKNKKILVIGAGGFTVSINDNLNNYTYIDIDKDLKKYSEKYFLNKKINGTFINNDIRFYLSNTKNKYDVIVLDAFSNKRTIPSFLLTQNFFSQIKQHLNQEGILLVNFIGSPKFKNTYSKHFNQTINSVFNCTVEPLSKSYNISNIIYSCYSKNDSIVYTDNKINLFELIQ